MSIDRVATSAQTAYFLSHIQNAGRALDKTQESIASGKNANTYAGFGDTVLDIGSEWALYEVTAKSDKALPTGQAVVGLQLAGAKQVIEIGQAIVVGPVVGPLEDRAAEVLQAQAQVLLVPGGQRGAIALALEEDPADSRDPCHPLSPQCPE